MATNVTLTINNASTNHVLTTGGRGPQGVAGAPGSDAEVTQANIEAAITDDAAFRTSIGAAPTVHTHTVDQITPLASGKLVGRHGGGSGAAQEVGLDGGLEFQGANIRREALTGDVTAAAGDNATTIATNVVTNAKLAHMATATIKGRTTAGTGDPEDLTASQARTVLGLGNAATMTVDSDLPTLSLPANTTISAFGATLIDDADAAAARTTLQLGTLATQSGTFSGTSSGTNTGDETGARIATLINAATEHTTALDADILPMTGTAAFGAFRRITFLNVWNYIKTKLDSVLTIAGAKTFTGQVELTNQLATNTTSAMTRALGDVRYGDWYRAQVVAAETGPTNSTAFQASSVLAISLTPGTWEFQSLELVSGGASFATAGAKTQMAFTGTATAPVGARFLATSSTQSPPYPTSRNVSGSGEGNIFPAVNSATASVSAMRIGTIVVTVTGTLQVEFGNVAAVSGNAASLLTPSYLRVRRIS